MANIASMVRQLHFGLSACTCLLALSSCSGQPAPVATAEPRAMAATEQPQQEVARWDPTQSQACLVHLPKAAAPRQLVVDGRPWGPEWPAELQIQTWAFDAESVAISFARGQEYLEADPREAAIYCL